MGDLPREGRALPDGLQVGGRGYERGAIQSGYLSRVALGAQALA
jgi:hypothetical protein